MRLAAATLSAALLAACTPSREIAPGVTAISAGQRAEPGTVRFSLAGVDDAKWTASIQQGAPDGSVRYGFTCKVLTCPEPAVVVLTTRRSPDERPNPQALEKFAKESLPKLTQAESLQLQVRSDNRAKAETLSSVVVRVQDYPAILNETKITIADRQRFVTTSTVFAGKLLVGIRAEAGDRATARIAVEDFARAFKVEEGPPAQ
jgi:hypothetical protein